MHRKYKGTNQQLQLRIIHSYITCVGGLDGRMLTFDGRINILVEAPYIQSDETVKANTKIKRKQGSITKTKQDDKRTDQVGQVKRQ